MREHSAVPDPPTDPPPGIYQIGETLVLKPGQSATDALIEALRDGRAVRVERTRREAM